jgi:CRISP-associated protein Cas1
MSMGELFRKDNSICFRNKQGNIYIPVETTREIFCLNEISLNTKLFDFISKAGIILHIFNYHGYYSGTFYPKRYLLSGNLTIKQSKIFIEKRSIIARSIVNSIAINIYQILYHYHKHEKQNLKGILDWLKYDIPILLKKTDDIKHILFVEGQIWMNFYQSFKNFINEEFVMNKRVKRPPDNPLNALISFGNSLLYAKCISQLYNTHLDQSISFLHEPREGRFSLSLDISEAFKPVIVYKTIFEAINNRRIQVDKHFDKKLNYCYLNEKGRKIFIELFEKRLSNVFKHPLLKRKISFETAIRLDGYKLIKMIIEDKPFIPFSLKEMK